MYSRVYPKKTQNVGGEGRVCAQGLASSLG